MKHIVDFRMSSCLLRKVEKVLCKVLLKWDTRLNGELESKAFHVVFVSDSVPLVVPRL